MDRSHSTPRTGNQAPKRRKKDSCVVFHVPFYQRDWKGDSVFALNLFSRSCANNLSKNMVTRSPPRGVPSELLPAVATRQLDIPPRPPLRPPETLCSVLFLFNSTPLSLSLSVKQNGEQGFIIIVTFFFFFNHPSSSSSTTFSALLRTPCHGVSVEKNGPRVLAEGGVLLQWD